MMRILHALLVIAAGPAPAGGSLAAQLPGTTDTAVVRRELEQWYEENQRAFRAMDVAAIMALRSEGFHTVAPDGTVRSRTQVEQYTQELLRGIDRWIELDFDLDSLEVAGDTARAVVRQHIIRMARRMDGQVHHLETWVTQRESWLKTPQGWKLHRVDGIHDQRRLIDGQPG
jgi:ketosteroid isomerase-like protein